jgi:hypothetical protein
LRTIRSATAIFALAFVLAALPVVAGSGVLAPSFIAWFEMERRMMDAASAVSIAYLLHLGLLLTAASVFATRRHSPEGHELLDLTETVPAMPSDRFFGDAAGILGALLTIHVCVLPLLGLAVILSPLPTAAFFWMELITLGVSVLISAAAAWNLHTATKGRRTQIPRSVATFMALGVVILRLTTDWQPFADAAWVAVLQPSPQMWRAVRATVASPAMLVACMVLLYAGFIAWFALQSVRYLERR